ncbi:MAG TPA: CopD family protein [Stellaceae bacterium]|nr:CopD family protein [Stellaceae bacterium]
MLIDSIALILHILSAVVWVGGMFFALVVLRPSTGPLDAPVRLGLWLRVLDRFFAWAFAAIVVLLLSGFAMIFSLFGGFAGVRLYINLMMFIGIVMMMLFLHLYFAPWKRFRAAMAAGDNAAAAAQLSQIRIVVMVNLILGLVTVAIGSSGRYWS